MSTTDNLQNIIERQKQVLSELEAEHLVLANSDLARENVELKAELDKLRQSYEIANSTATKLTGENASLKNALHEQIYSEKVKIINSTAQKLDIYFATNIQGELNKLTALENSVRARSDQIRATLAQNNVALSDDIYIRLGELDYLLDTRLTELRANAAQLAGAFSQAEVYELETLKNAPISDEQIRSIAKKNNLERFVGLNVLNVVGVFLLIIGSITLAHFAYVRLTDLLKGIMLFGLGGIMLAAGELLNKKAPNVFSLGISAGGIGILYSALATSYFGLLILDMYPALLICVLITAVAFVLSNRYNSQTIAVFALVGGYLPIFSLGFDIVVLYGAMLYFVLLNLLALLISLNKKWRISSFVGLGLNIFGTIYICLSFYGSQDILQQIIVLIYTLFAFFVYTAIPMLSTYRTKAKFVISDIVFLGINTLFSSLIITLIFFMFRWQDFDGILAVIFALVYLMLGNIIDKKFTDEKRMSVLFYLTGFAFVVLIIPMQFGMVWCSLGWLAEGVGITSYGVYNNDKRFRQVGYVICLLCLVAFFIYDITSIYSYLFVFKYLAITLGSLIILGTYMLKRMTTGQFVTIYKYCVLVNVWLFGMYLLLFKLWEMMNISNLGYLAYHVDYLLYAASVVWTFAIAYIFARIRLLADSGIKILSLTLYAIGIVILFAINATNTPVDSNYLQIGTPALVVTIVGSAILIVLGLLSVLAVRDFIKIIILEKTLGIEWYPLIISGYFVIILTQNLIMQFQLSFTNVVISIIYVLTALAWIIYGFARRYSFIRLFGLGMAILTVIKLFLLDLASLTQGRQIISYFALGITLLAISFVYQYFNKRLELSEEESIYVDKNHT